MLELLFLLLPIAALYGWYMGQRSQKKDQDTIQNKFSRDYVTGLNFLLSNQQEKAVDLFLSMLEKQQNEHQISADSPFEAQLTLGNLFRSRGEIDRALRIHQALESDLRYSQDQRLLAKKQLAKDFIAVGFYDRAEHCYIELLDEPEYAEAALTELADIYRRTKEWKKAINVSEKLQKIAPNTDKTALAHFYCEYAEIVGAEQAERYVGLLKMALKLHPDCVRASVALGDFYLLRGGFSEALAAFEQVLAQDPHYISLVLEKIATCYRKLNQPDGFELFLIKANQIKHDCAIDLALASLIEQKDSKELAQHKLYQQITHYPHMLSFHRFIGYQIDDAEAGRAKESLQLLYEMVGNRIKKSAQFHCIQCGYQSVKLSWFCPHCRHWESIKPVQSLDENI